ncbi:hypothetical protein [Niallia taxi]|nr:hypothetical protein [Niallia taxi]
MLAFTINKEFDEKDDTVIYPKPHPEIVAVLKENINALEMYKHHLPESL